MANVLITGGAGFIGSHITDAYLGLGHRVVVLDNLSTGRRENIHPEAVFVEMDIMDLKVAELFEQESFDVVNHHAAQLDVRKSVADPMYDARVNILGSVNLLEACVRTGVKKFIFASSGGACYGEQSHFPADESHPNNPVSPYGIAKLTVEKYLYYYGFSFGLDYVALRYANVYGPRQNGEGEAGVIAIFINKMLTQKQPVVFGDGLQTRDYVFVRDVVNANQKAFALEGRHVINIGTGIETDVNQLLLALNDIFGMDISPRHEPGKKGEQLRSVLDAAKAKEIMEWSPEVSIGEGLRRTAEFFKGAASR